jgi:hypothetical protein
MGPPLKCGGPADSQKRTRGNPAEDGRRGKKTSKEEKKSKVEKGTRADLYYTRRSSEDGPNGGESCSGVEPWIKKGDHFIPNPMWRPPKEDEEKEKKKEKEKEEEKEKEGQVEDKDSKADVKPTQLEQQDTSRVTVKGKGKEDKKGKREDNKGKREGKGKGSDNDSNADVQPTQLEQQDASEVTVKGVV